MLPNISLWNLLFTVALGAWILECLIPAHFEGVFFPLALLGVIYAKPLGIEALSPWSLLGAALLLTIGWSMLFHGNGYRRRQKVSVESDESAGEENDFISCDVAFRSSSKYISSAHFREASFHCTFGNLKAYFQSAKLAQDNARIDVSAQFGSIELYVPRTWQVVSHVHNMLSSIEEKNKTTEPAEHTVELTGDLAFASVKIYYV